MLEESMKDMPVFSYVYTEFKRSLFCMEDNFSAEFWTKGTFFALQMKGRWQSSLNVWFPFLYSQKLNCYFQNRIIMFCLPVPTLIYLWEILYISRIGLPIFCCRKICGPILGIYKSLTDTWMWKLGVRPRHSQKRNK